MLDDKLIELLIQVPVGVIAIYALIMSMRAMNANRAKELEIERLQELNHKYQIERETSVALVRAETDNTTAQNQARLIEQTQQMQRFLEQAANVIAANTRLIGDNVTVTRERTAAALQEAAALTSFSERFSIELSDVKTAINAAGERMTASREATDNRLATIQAGVEYSNKAIDAAKQTIDTLPLDTSKVVLELGEQAANDHLRILEAADRISKQIENLPAYLVKSLAPIVDELKSAAQELRVTEGKLLDVVKLVVPPPEAVPMNEKTVGQLAADALRAEMGKA